MQKDTQREQWKSQPHRTTACQQAAAEAPSLQPRDCVLLEMGLAAPVKSSATSTPANVLFATLRKTLNVANH